VAHPHHPRKRPFWVGTSPNGSQRHTWLPARRKHQLHVASARGNATNTSKFEDCSHCSHCISLFGGGSEWLGHTSAHPWWMSHDRVFPMLRELTLFFGHWESTSMQSKPFCRLSWANKLLTSPCQRDSTIYKLPNNIRCQNTLDWCVLTLEFSRRLRSQERPSNLKGRTEVLVVGFATCYPWNVSISQLSIWYLTLGLDLTSLRLHLARQKKSIVTRIKASIHSLGLEFRELHHWYHWAKKIGTLNRK